MTQYRRDALITELSNTLRFIASALWALPHERVSLPSFVGDADALNELFQKLDYARIIVDREPIHETAKDDLRYAIHLWVVACMALAQAGSPKPVVYDSIKATLEEVSAAVLDVRERY